MKIESKIAITKIARIVLIVLATFVFFYGYGASKKAGQERKIQRAAEKIELIVTERTNEHVMYSSAKCDFFCTIKNNSKVEINKISGTHNFPSKE